MDTVVIHVRVGPSHREEIIAAAAELGCYAFDEDEAELRAYIADGDFRQDIADRLAADARHGDSSATVDTTRIAAENWNAQWEASIHPVITERFVIAPSWANEDPIWSDRIVIRVDPKMSFGTGHHESTRLVLSQLPDVVKQGSSFLDAGTGSGVLAIAAVKLGAQTVIGFDIDEWAAANARENALLNHVAGRIDVRLGDLDAVPEGDFDLIAANINRSVLLDYLHAMCSKLSDTGTLILSGLLLSDRLLLLDALGGARMNVLRESAEGEWWSVTAVSR